VGRAERERAAYDDGDVWDNANRWHARFLHVFKSPNTLRHERLFEDRIRACAAGRRVLEVGCGDGVFAQRILALGAAYVYGIDVSEKFLAMAKVSTQPGRLEFANVDASQPIGAEFDAIVGRGVLHHLDYQPVLRRLFRETLRANGTMIFMEPLGSNPLLQLYRLLVPGAQTPDEQPFGLDDLRWFKGEFPSAEIHPYNLTSLPAGMLSSFLFAEPDNALLRMTDALDTWLAGKALWLDSFFRYTILIVRKPAAPGSLS